MNSMMRGRLGVCGRGLSVVEDLAGDTYCSTVDSGAQDRSALARVFSPTGRTRGNPAGLRLCSVATPRSG